MLKRKEKDIIRLKTKFEVNEPPNSEQIVVTIPGPENSLYQLAKWYFIQFFIKFQENRTYFSRIISL